MSGIFGGRDLFGRLFGSTKSGSTAPPGTPAGATSRLKGPIIEELDSEDENMLGDKDEQESISVNENPLIEHPEDQTDDHNKSNGKSKSKELSYRSAHGKVEGEQHQTGGISFQRVTYGGINGTYYTASTSRRTGSDGVVLEESRVADKTTGRATHRVSKGVHDKGHSVSRKLNPDGKVDTLQTLHNLDEDEQAGFEQSWKGNADMHMPGWENGFDFHSNIGSGGSWLTSRHGWDLPFREHFGRDARLRPDPDAQAHSARGRSKKVEGAAFEDGRTPSIWDTFTHAGRSNGANGDIACDAYHKYKEDVQLMVNTGLEAYRFSISWSRIIPNGRGTVNPKGLQYYNNLINEITSHGLQPHITLYHDDLPQALEDKYGGWRSRKIVKDFTAFADVCFKEFGDRIMYWTTFNEANVFSLGGYDIGFLPPGRCSLPLRTDCIWGNSSTEPYIVAHNILLAHSSAAKLYKEKYKATQQGFLGFNIFIYWFIPYTNATNDLIATQRALDFYVGWFMNPLVFGDYPDTVKKNAGKRIPAFTRYESMQVKGSFDFIGVNHYATLYVMDNSSSLEFNGRDVMADMAIKIMSVDERDDKPKDLFPVTPRGLYGTLEYLKKVYGNPPIYIHENGQQMRRNGTLNDTARVEYLQAYIGSMLDAIRNGSNTKGYFVWSFLDGLELLDGYNSGYGLYYVDLDDKELKRYPKLSAQWYSNFLSGRSTRQNQTIEFEKITTSTSYKSHSSH